MACDCDPEIMEPLNKLIAEGKGDIPRDEEAPQHEGPLAQIVHRAMRKHEAEGDST